MAMAVSPAAAAMPAAARATSSNWCPWSQTCRSSACPFAASPAFWAIQARVMAAVASEESTTEAGVDGGGAGWEWAQASSAQSGRNKARRDTGDSKGTHSGVWGTATTGSSLARERLSLRRISLRRVKRHADVPPGAMNPGPHCRRTSADGGDEELPRGADVPLLRRRSPDGHPQHIASGCPLHGGQHRVREEHLAGGIRPLQQLPVARIGGLGCLRRKRLQAEAHQRQGAGHDHLEARIRRHPRLEALAQPHVL